MTQDEIASSWLLLEATYGNYISPLQVAQLKDFLKTALTALEEAQAGIARARESGYRQGATETKERILIAIKMAGGMAEQFGNQVKAETVAHIYVLVEALPIDTDAEQEGVEE